MSFQPAGEVPLQGDVARKADKGAASANDQDKLLPTPLIGAEALVTQDDGTRWIFWWNIDNHLGYTRITPEDKVSQHILLIDGSPLFGRTHALSATRLANSPRVYWIDRDGILREAVLSGKSGDNWRRGLTLTDQEYSTYVNTSITSGGDHDNLPTGVYLQILFHERAHFPQWTQLNLGKTWKRTLLPLK